MALLISFFAFFGFAFVIISLLAKLVQKTYNETGYNGLNWLTKFLMLFYGIANLFIFVFFYDSIEKKQYGFAACSIVVFILLFVILMLANRRAGLKNAFLLSVLQDIGGIFMISVFVFDHFIMPKPVFKKLEDAFSLGRNNN